MILNAIVILGILGLAFAWSSKARGYGFFSALVTLACVLISGAIAFGLWETVVHVGLFPLADGDGFLATLAKDNAWGVGLLAPFVVSLLVLRQLADRFVSSNLHMSDTGNLVGGGLVGLAIGATTMGIVVIGLGHMRTGTALFGYAPIEDDAGNMRYSSPLWVPVDMAVATLYEGMSVGAFSTGTPLAEYRPSPHVSAGLLRMTYDGAARTTVLPGDVEIKGQYTITGPLNEILTDRMNPAKQQQPVTLFGDTPEEGSTLLGYVMQFNAGAKEKSGNVLATSAQVQLLVENNGSLKRLLPIALVERTEGGSLTVARFRYDAEGTAASSVGGSATTIFAFEFLLPPGAEPVRMFVKGLRLDLDGVTSQPFASADARDDAIVDGSIFSNFGVNAAGSASAGEIDDSQSQALRPDDRGRFEGVRTGARLPYNIRLQSSIVRGRMTLGDENRLQSGTGEFDENASAPRDMDRSLVVEELDTPPGTSLVQVEIASQGRKSIFGRSMDAAERVASLTLRDTIGASYQPIGYILQEGSRTTISIDVANPIRALSQIPALSSTRQQSLTLIFAPSSGVTIDGFLIGNREVIDFGEEGLEVRR